MIVTVGVLVLLVVALVVAVLARRPRRAGQPVPVGHAEPGESLAAKVDRLAARLSLNEEFNRRLNRVFGVLLAVLALEAAIIVVLGLFLLGLRSQGDRLDAADADRVASTAVARYGSCVQANVDKLNTREAIIGGIVDTVRPLFRDPLERDNFARTLRANVETRLPYRTCTVDAIADFLNHPPGDPGAVPTVPEPTSTTMPGG